MGTLTEEQLKDLKTLARFIAIFCHCKHDRRQTGEVPIPEPLRSGDTKHDTLCADCAQLLEHGITKRRLCPLDPKPACKNCHIHCYTPEYRQQIRRIMAYSGKRMVLKGRLDYLWHYFIKS